MDLEESEESLRRTTMKIEEDGDHNNSCCESPHKCCYCLDTKCGMRILSVCNLLIILPAYLFNGYAVKLKF